jgi:glycosyltransferase involved in cell wall biosynthesis
MSNRRIKVIFGLNDLLVGGMQRQFTEQLKHFDRTRFDISLVTLFSFPEKPDLYAELPKDLAVTRLSFSGLFDFSSWMTLYTLLRREKPDIVVSSLFAANMIFRVLQPFFRYIPIAREHNTYVDKPLWQRLVDRILASHSQPIVTVSCGVADFTAKQEGIPRNRFEVIRNGIDITAFQQRLRAISDKSKEHKPILLCVARFQEQKNHLLLLDGFVKFLCIEPRARLILVGYGPLEDMLQKRVVDLGIEQSVIFTGIQKDVAPFFKVADMYVSTSRIEGLSNSYLEALAAGIPIIATKTAGTDELINEGINGLFIPETTPEAVAETLTRGMRLQSGAIIVELARQFDIRDTVRAYEDLFTRVVIS